MNINSLPRGSFLRGKKGTHWALHGSLIYLLFLVSGLLISDEELIMNVLCLHVGNNNGTISLRSCKCPE
jgi:hypothetical protein